MSIEIHSLHDVVSNPKLVVLFLLLLIQIGLLVSAMVCGSIAGIRARQKMSLHEFVMADVFANPLRLLADDCVKRPVIKLVVCVIAAIAVGVITALYCVMIVSCGR